MAQVLPVNPELGEKDVSIDTFIEISINSTSLLKEKTKISINGEVSFFFRQPSLIISKKSVLLFCFIDFSNESTRPNKLSRFFKSKFDNRSVDLLVTLVKIKYMFTPLKIF